VAYPDANALLLILDALAGAAGIELPAASRAGVCDHLANAGRMAAALESLHLDDHQLSLAPIFHACDPCSGGSAHSE